MIGQPFNQLFEAGDVIYGFGGGASGPRYRYSQTLVNGRLGRTPAQLFTEGNFTICDNYNNNTFNMRNGVSYFENLQIGENRMKTNWATLNAAQRGSVEPYYNSLLGSKYNPHLAMTTNLSGNKLLNNGGNNSVDRQATLAFRRACKFGLDYFMETQQHSKVHFVLDADLVGTPIDFEGVVRKELFTRSDGVTVLPITYSELRRCYKKRFIYRDRLYFYLNLRRVEAPWDEDPELWAEIDAAKNSPPRLTKWRRFRNFFRRRSR